MPSTSFIKELTPAEVRDQLTGSLAGVTLNTTATSFEGYYVADINITWQPPGPVYDERYNYHDQGSGEGGTGW